MAESTASGAEHVRRNYLSGFLGIQLLRGALPKLVTEVIKAGERLSIEVVRKDGQGQSRTQDISPDHVIESLGPGTDRITIRGWIDFDGTGKPHWKIVLDYFLRADDDPSRHVCRGQFFGLFGNNIDHYGPAREVGYEHRAAFIFLVCAVRMASMEAGNGIRLPYCDAMLGAVQRDVINMLASLDRRGLAETPGARRAWAKLRANLEAIGFSREEVLAPLQPSEEEGSSEEAPTDTCDTVPPSAPQDDGADAPAAEAVLPSDPSGQPAAIFAALLIVASGILLIANI